MLQQPVLFDEIKIHYWTPDEGIAEVDFVVQLNGSIVPIEVKAEVNLKAKSLAQFIKRYNTPNVIRTSLEKYFKGEKITNVPLFAIYLLPNMLK
ncbi:MAG: DUF4143 domain-containing protein [Bacteroidales bacterium]|nr:DUF4143 domain-containing protein [Bacteroidales bacterium]